MAAAPGVFDPQHFQKFKSELDSYLHDKEREVRQSQGVHTEHDQYVRPNDDPFFLSC